MAFYHSFEKIFKNYVSLPAGLPRRFDNSELRPNVAGLFRRFDNAELMAKKLDEVAEA